MIYFDNAATGGFKPDSVISAVTAALKCCANPGRSGHKLSVACLERVYACRKLLSEFFGGYGYERVVFTKNCTEALNIAILGVIKSGDEAVTTVAEHNSVLRPLEFLKGRGVTVKYAPLDGEGNIDVSALVGMVTEKTKAVVITLASNVTGTAPDIAEISRSIPEKCLLICDGAQACGHIGIDMQKSGIDALAVAGHKGMLGIQGSGALLFSERFNPDPVTFGGTGSESQKLCMPDFYPDRLESGTLSYAAIISLAEGALYLSQNMQRDAQNTLKMAQYLCKNLSQMHEITLYSHPNPFGVIALGFNDLQSELAAHALSEMGICVRGGLHCAPLMHKALKSDGLVRVSLSAFNTQSECEQLVAAIRKIAVAR